MNAVAISTLVVVRESPKTVWCVCVRVEREGGGERERERERERE